VSVFILLASMTVLTARGDEPLLTKLMIDRFATQQTQGLDPLVLEGRWVKVRINSG